MNQPLLIGISGVKQAGKGEAAHCIQQWAASLGYTAFDRGFADKVKWAFARIFFPDITMADAIEWVNAHKNDPHLKVVIESDLYPQQHLGEITLRTALTHVGTEGGRDVYGDDHWVTQLLPYGMTSKNNDPTYPLWNEEFNLADFCTISDLRFENEMARIKTIQPSITVKIRRREAELAVIEEYKRQGKEIHRSELGMPDEEYDYVINNDGSKEELALRVRTMMKEVCR